MSELSIVRDLVAQAISLDLSVSVFDGEEWPVKKSTDMRVIMEAMQATDQETLRFRDNVTGERIGDVWLVWGNSEEEVIADYTDNEAMRTLVESVS